MACWNLLCRALCPNPPPSHQVDAQAAFLRAEVKQFAGGLLAAHCHCTAGPRTLGPRAEFFFLRSNYWYYHDWQPLVVFGLCSTEHSVRCLCFVLSRPQANTPALFLSSPCAVSLPLSVSLSLFFAEWYKFTKMRPDRKGHKWLPVQCVRASCSVTLNNFDKKKNPWPSWGRCCSVPRHPNLYTLL